jgi:hypothetical protein
MTAPKRPKLAGKMPELLIELEISSGEGRDNHKSEQVSDAKSRRLYIFESTSRGRMSPRQDGG